MLLTNKSLMPYSILSQDVLKQCACSEIITGKKGQKYAEIKFDDAQTIFQLSKEPLCSPCQAGVFQDDGTATRINLELNVDENTQKVLDSFDNFFQENIENAGTWQNISQTSATIGGLSPSDSTQMQHIRPFCRAVLVF